MQASSNEPLDLRFNIRLTDRPGKEGLPLAGAVWRIVRMQQPTWKKLGRVPPEDLIAKGESDAQGLVNLTDSDQKKLSLEYAKHPKMLWLVYPGQCVALQVHVERNWSEEQKQALAIASMDFSTKPHSNLEHADARHDKESAMEDWALPDASALYNKLKEFFA